MTSRRTWVACLLLLGACNVYPETAPEAAHHDLDSGAGTDSGFDVSIEAGGNGGQAGAAGDGGTSGSSGTGAVSGQGGIAGSAGDVGDGGPAGAAGDSGSTVKISATLAAGSDDANEDSKTFVADGATVWLGNGKKSGHAGFRFSGVDIPANAQILSASVRVYASASTSTATAFDFHAEAADDCATFSSAAPPSSRSLAATSVPHPSSGAWTANTWYVLDDVAALVQEVAARSGWASGNHLCVILVGTGADYERREVVSRDASATNSAVLEIEYAKP
jgi:hypothetical protein